MWPTAADVHTRKRREADTTSAKLSQAATFWHGEMSQVTSWAHPVGDALRWAAGAKCPSNARGPRWPPEPTKCVMCRRHAGPVP